MLPRVRQPSGLAKIVRLENQADRARTLAANCGDPLLAELFALHAQLSEENAKKPAPPR